MDNGMGVLTLNLLVSGTFGALLLLLLAFTLDDRLLRADADQAVSRSFRDSRLRRMLLLRHLSPDDYLKLTSRDSRALHLSICGSCGHKRECDRAVRDGGASDYSFCVNGTMIDRLLRDQAAL